MRYLTKNILSDLEEKMVFLSGPRQVGKTTLALSLLKEGTERHPAYFNWDSAKRRKSLLAEEVPANERLIVLDEIHKYKGWRNLLKGLYDMNKSTHQFLVTGSARLDYYRRGGDSLQGRYHLLRLHPLTLPEISRTAVSGGLDTLLRFGGFPEPFFKQSERVWKRWQMERLTRAVQEDLISLENVKDVSTVNLLVSLLPERVGSLLSVNNLSGDLSVSFATVDRWLKILENIFVCFRIPPFKTRSLPAIRKERKLYLWDWSQIENPSFRFENLIASHLIKYCHYIEDTEGEPLGLHFLRDKNGREIDFVVTKNKKPLFGVESKTGERDLSRSIRYFSDRLDIPRFYQVHLGKKNVEISRHRARILPFSDFCGEVGLV